MWYMLDGSYVARELYDQSLIAKKCFNICKGLYNNHVVELHGVFIYFVGYQTKVFFTYGMYSNYLGLMEI